MIECHEHGKVSLGYIVCVHALAGAPVARRAEPTGGGPEGLGEILCLACHMEEEPRLDNLKLICGGCVAKVFGAEEVRH